MTMLFCNNCGERIAAHGHGEVICDVCGVVQQQYTQTIVEEFTGSYSQTQRVGRLKPAESVKDDAPKPSETDSRDFQVIMGMQMVLENLSKILVKSFGFSNQVEVEAKNIWSRYLNLIMKNEIPIGNMFADLSTKRDKDSVESIYFKRTFQVPMNYEHFNIPKRLHKVISDMGCTSFEYALMINAHRKARYRDGNAVAGTSTQWQDINEYKAVDQDKKRSAPTYDNSEGVVSLEDSDMLPSEKSMLDKENEVPSGSPGTATGIPIYVMIEAIGRRKLPTTIWVSKVRLKLESGNPYKLAYKMDSIYRHDFLWRLLYAYPTLEPLEKLEHFIGAYSDLEDDDTITIIESNPLELEVLVDIARSLGITGCTVLSQKGLGSKKRLRMELINLIFKHIITYYFGDEGDPGMQSFNLSWIVPKMDLELVCTILYLALIKCRYPVVLNDIVRWVLQGRIPVRSSACLLPQVILNAAVRETYSGVSIRNAPGTQVEMSYNLFTNAKVPHSSTHLENITSRLVLCGMLSDFERNSNMLKSSFNVHGLCRRIVHHLRLPTNVIPVTDMLIERINNLCATVDYDMIKLPVDCAEHHLGRMKSIYGTSMGLYPSHAFAAACVLAACRLLWPIFHFNPPALPRRQYPGNTAVGTIENDRIRYSDSMLESFIIRRERYGKPIEFDAMNMRWIVRVSKYPVEAMSRDDWHSYLQKDTSLNSDELSFLRTIVHSMSNVQGPLNRQINSDAPFTLRHYAEEMRSQNSDPPNFFQVPDATETHHTTTKYIFDARHRGYYNAGLSALLWLFHHCPYKTIEVLSKYYVPSDCLSLRRMAADMALVLRPSLLSHNLLRLYAGLTPPAGNDKIIAAKLQDKRFRDLCINMAGLWSGSLIHMFGFVEKINQGEPKLCPAATLEAGSNTKMVSSAINFIRPLLLEQTEKNKAYGAITGSLPGNNEVYFKITSLFSQNPNYSGWNPEKSFDLDTYRSCVPNQRNQLLEWAAETLAMKIHLKQNDAWCFIAERMEKALVLQHDEELWKETCPLRSLEESYNALLRNIENGFQDMGTVTSVGRLLPPFPWRDYRALGEEMPMTYVLMLKAVSRFIGAPLALIHSCLCNIEHILTKSE
uniref:Anonymous antigen-7 n=1 Tax=Babesia bovis TaxID=5865 RepID=Q2PKF7_BABBO|nr:anonymous antigen-7 [Babesia bovis]